METSPLQINRGSGSAAQLQQKAPAASVDRNELQVTLHTDGLPPGAATEMDWLYQNLFSSSAMFRTHGPASGVQTYVVRRGGHAVTILAFRIDGVRVHVMNEQISLSGEEIERFAEFVFQKFSQIRSIVFKAVQTLRTEFTFPHQRYGFTNDIVLTLPTTSEAYLDSLGKSTRDNIKRYLKLCKRDFPTFSFESVDGWNTPEESLRAIVAFNHERMAGKSKVSGLTDAESARLIALARTCGLVSTVRIDGRICAGTICYRVGDNFFMRVIAHDSCYDTHRLGLLCCYLTICECIRRNARHYHFLWGREEYKYRLLGQQRDFDTITLYRSRVAYLRDGVAVAKKGLRARVAAAKLWLLDPANEGRAAARFARMAKERLRGRKG
ncbi:MAG: family N-acetyltransferase [Herminiimonas sp.]|nr:family N-acetyltransferase [Herminiimonas sp.]MDB5855762.1 family N-acetyltransferase [Herminiimonas sp.]